MRSTVPTKKKRSRWRAAQRKVSSEGSAVSRIA
jgi:hypothetical protein